jgi:hypothetical protein
MSIALAATGIAVAGAASPQATKATPATTSTHDASYTTAASSQRQRAMARNPRGTAYVHRAGPAAHFHGRVTDPDNHHRRLTVALWRNGHKVETARTDRGTHHYTLRSHLNYGKNHYVVIAKNIGRGTNHTRLRAAHMRLGWSWAAHYQGNKRIAAEMFKHYGWGESQMQSLINLWNRESGWSTTAANPSGAYGIPQALPGSKMSSAGPNWQYNAQTQIRWGLGYIAARYGSPNSAWGHSQATGWY